MATNEAPIETVGEIETEHSAVGSLKENENLMAQARDYAPPALALGALFLPWASISAPFMGNVSMTGMDMDIGLILAGAAVGVMAAVYKGWTRARLAAGALALVLSLLGWFHIQSVFAEGKAELAGNMFAGAVQMNTGMGVYLAIIASAAIVYTAWKAYSQPSA